MLKVALTGGIGSGKSTVSRYFRELDIPVISADDIAHELVQPGSETLAEIIKLFGKELLTKTGELNRAALREQVFNDEHARQQLEAIMHPRILTEMFQRCDTLEAPYVILEIPLLFETKTHQQVDRVLVLDCAPALQIERVMARDNLTQEQVQKIIDAQTPRKERLSIADDVILNESDEAAIAEQVQSLDRLYREL